MKETRDKMLIKVRANNLTNALFLIESKEELLEALRNVPIENLIALRTMIGKTLNDN
jgi:hypothetical protein